MVEIEIATEAWVAALQKMIAALIKFCNEWEACQRAHLQERLSVFLPNSWARQIAQYWPTRYLPTSWGNEDD